MGNKIRKKKFERLILTMGANEDPNKIKLLRALTKFGIRDLFKEITGENGPATHFRGKNRIDGIWSTKDIHCHVAIFIPL